MAGDTDINNTKNILTPSKLIVKGKRTHDDMNKNDELIENLQKQLESEKQNNEYLKNELSEMRTQLNTLTETITNLNKTINNIQAHNKKLLKTIQKKSKSKIDTKNETHIEQKDMSHQATPDSTPKQHIHTQSPNSPLDIMNMSTNSTILSSDDEDENETNDDKKKTNDNHTEPTPTVKTHTPSTTTDNKLTKTATTTTNTEFQENERVQRNAKIPPIDIWTANQEATQTLIRNQMPTYSCIFNKINKTKMRVIPKTADVRTKLLNLLTQKQIEYNTYTPTDNKMQNVLLKGTEIHDKHIIKEALTKVGIQAHNIQKFETGYMRQNNINSNIWQITLQPKTDTNTIINIRYIAEWSVKWEMMKKPPITQCRRCQRFNHSASNCTLSYRCVKCVESHEPGMCKLDNNTNKTKPTCVNCKGEHTANNARLCPVYKKQMEIKEEKKKQKNTQHTHTNSTNTMSKRISTTQYASKENSYAKVAKQTKTYDQQQTNINNNKNDNNNQDITQLIFENQRTMQTMLASFIESQNKMMNALTRTNG